jgi:hypothetical protein
MDVAEEVEPQPHMDVSFEIPLSEASPKLGSTMESRLTIPTRNPIQLRQLEHQPSPQSQKSGERNETALVLDIDNSSDMSYTDRFDTHLLHSIMDSKETLSFG